jgi:hypothetical protein
MSFLVNSFRFGGSAFYQYAVAKADDTDHFDPGNLHSSGAFTVPAAWNGRKVRVGNGARSAAGSTGATMTMSKNGSQFDGAGAAVFPGVTSNPGGGTSHSAPVVVSTGDTFTFTGQISGQDGSWMYMEVLPSGVRGALVNRTSTFSVGTAFTTAQWNNEVYDTHGFFDTGVSTTEFEIPSGTSGVARLSANIELTAPGTEMGLKLNGFLAQGLAEVDTASGPQTGLSLSIRCQSATTMKVDANTWFAIEELPSSLKWAIARFGSTSATIANGVGFVSVSPNNQEVDVGGWYTPGDSFFTVPSGVTRVRLGFFLRSSNTLGSIFCFGIFKNGVEHTLMPYNAQTNASAEMIHAFSAPIECSPGDTFEFKARTSAGSMAIAADSIIWIEEVQDVTS